MIIDKQIIELDYKINNYIKYNDETGSNYIDISNKTFERQNSEFKMKIDFLKKKFFYELKQYNLINESDIECEFTKNVDTYTLKYRISLEEIEIIIHIL